MSQSRPLFVYFCSFLIIISIIQSEKSLNGVLCIWTRSHRMVGADETMELGRSPQNKIVCWYFWQIFIIFSEYLTLWSAISAQTKGCLILLSFISFVVQTFSAVTSRHLSKEQINIKMKIKMKMKMRMSSKSLEKAWD